MTMAVDWGQDDGERQRVDTGPARRVFGYLRSALVALGCIFAGASLGLVPWTRLAASRKSGA